MTEPTEEQYAVAHDEYEDAHGCIDAERVARLLAHREARLMTKVDGLEESLRAEVEYGCSASAEIDALRAKVSTLQAERGRLEALVTEEARLIRERDDARADVERLTKDNEALAHARNEVQRIANEDLRRYLAEKERLINGWAHVEARHLETIRALREARGGDSPWPLSEALVALIDGCEMLLRDYDGPNANHPNGRPYEEITMAVRRGRQMLAALDTSREYEQADDAGGAR